MRASFIFIFWVDQQPDDAGRTQWSGEHISNPKQSNDPHTTPYYIIYNLKLYENLKFSL